MRPLTATLAVSLLLTAPGTSSLAHAMPAQAVAQQAAASVTLVRCAYRRCRIIIAPSYYRPWPPLYGYERLRRDYWYRKGPARIWY